MIERARLYIHPDYLAFFFLRCKSDHISVILFFWETLQFGNMCGTVMTTKKPNLIASRECKYHIYHQDNYCICSRAYDYAYQASTSSCSSPSLFGFIFSLAVRVKYTSPHPYLSPCMDQEHF
ncbi:TPA_asm: hypothetical protein HUJ06_032050 [Nelumbo nucifera]|uniref:Uncharacterized protein n=1 Tax=Nelumbo nucifera TaxID=4432 RepID=A0A822ZUH0_NELNU|nr:TPA_asm: hypothetical protein HUJ06_032050 [Nelumbo nucifera]